MSKTHLKICGVTDAVTAAYAVQLGVDYIGVVFHPTSPRYIDRVHAQAIADVVHEQGGCLVSVFVDQQLCEIVDIAQSLSVDVIQLHGRSALQYYEQITQHFPCIIAAHLADDLTRFNPIRDFLLYDAPTAGGGQMFDWQAAQIDTSYRCFIAGGINVENAKAAIAQFQPFGLDVSSGVETVAGQKSLQLIRELYNVIKA